MADSKKSSIEQSAMIGGEFDFDPYLAWLGIRDPERPPNHYRLLGVDLLESDPDVIETAADRQMAHVRRFQNGPHSDVSQDLLNELAAARLCLLKPENKAKYDALLAEAEYRRRQLESSDTKSDPKKRFALAVVAAMLLLVATIGVAIFWSSASGNRGVPHAAANNEQPSIVQSNPVPPPIDDSTEPAVENISISKTEPTKTIPPRDANAGSIGDNSGSPTKHDSTPPSDHGDTNTNTTPPTDSRPNDTASPSNPTSVEPTGPWAVPLERAFEPPVIAGIFDKCRSALAERRLADARYAWQDAHAKVVSDHHRSESQRLDQLMIYLEQFWNGIAQLPTAEDKPTSLKYDGTWVNLVGATTESVRLKAENGAVRDFTLEFERFDSRLALALATYAVQRKHISPASVTAFWALDRDGDLYQVDARLRGLGDAHTDRKLFRAEYDAALRKHTYLAAPVKPDLTAAELQSRLEIPPAELRMAALDELKKKHKERYTSGNPRVRLALAVSFLRYAESGQGDPAQTHAWLTEAWSLAIGANDPEIALQVIDATTARFQVDRWQGRAETLDKLARTVTDESAPALLEHCTLVAENAAAAEKFAAAEQIWQAANRVAAQRKDAGLRRQFAQRESVATEMKKLALNYQEATARLSETPDDPTDNLHVGRYLCFVRGDIAAGIVHLARCSHNQLKTAAKLELTRTSAETPSAVLRVADAWWAAQRGQPKVVQNGIRRHAASLYQRVLNDLSESDRRRVQRRLKLLKSV